MVITTNGLYRVSPKPTPIIIVSKILFSFPCPRAQDKPNFLGVDLFVWKPRTIHSYLMLLPVMFGYVVSLSFLDGYDVPIALGRLQRVKSRSDGYNVNGFGR